MNPSPKSAEERAFAKLIDSSLYKTYRAAFLKATGIWITLTPADDESELASMPASNQTDFCTLLNQGKGCQSCGQLHRSLVSEACDRPKTVHCFAGLRESAVPVWAGKRVLAILRFGQVLSAPPSGEQFAALIERLTSEGWNRAAVGSLRTAYESISVVGEEQYSGCFTLINAFALHLSEELNRLLISEENQEPPTIAKAKQYVNAHLEDRITLESVAAHIGISPFYFCKLFKQAVGMTLTEFVNRRRVEWAKRKLANPNNRITEVAYDVGYQSLSQFNRSFLRYVGESPSQFRERNRSQGLIKAAA